LGVVATPNRSGRRYSAPRGERARTQKSLMAGPKPMSPNGEKVAHDVVDCEELPFSDRMNRNAVFTQL
jgi:hypothetical protein